MSDEVMKIRSIMHHLHMKKNLAQKKFFAKNFCV